MKVEELREEIAIELESLEATVQELVALRKARLSDYLQALETG